MLSDSDSWGGPFSLRHVGGAQDSSQVNDVGVDWGLFFGLSLMDNCPRMLDGCVQFEPEIARKSQRSHKTVEIKVFLLFFLPF